MKRALLAGILAVLVVVASPRAQALSARQREYLTVLCSRLHATDLAQVRLGRLARRKGLTVEVRRYGDRLLRDHRHVDRLVVDLARSFDIELIRPIAWTRRDWLWMQGSRRAGHDLETLARDRFDRQYLRHAISVHGETIRMLRRARVERAAHAAWGLIDGLVPLFEQHRELGRNLLAETPR